MEEKGGYIALETPPPGMKTNNQTDTSIDKTKPFSSFGIQWHTCFTWIASNESETSSDKFFLCLF